ncbi:MAG: 50S ribosomal protein L4 [Patescibacteria group bacterium]|nr:MAG: 50S ribosomal protein L4 [Patescibacteria group bacterium]
MPRTKRTINEEKNKITDQKTVEKKQSEFVLPVYDLIGEKKEDLDLPKEIFGFKVNEKLLAQAVRVYLFNQRQGTVSTKTRGEVAGSTRKIYRQKGTGRARHGSIKAPIFVGGGIVGGPKPKDYSLKINKKQNRQAILSALSLQFKNKNILVFDDKILNENLKTKTVFQLLKKLDLNDKKTLFVLPKMEEKFIRASRNIEKTDFIDAKSINAYKILNCQKLVLFKSSVLEIKNHFKVN